MKKKLGWYTNFDGVTIPECQQCHRALHSPVVQREASQRARELRTTTWSQLVKYLDSYHANKHNALLNEPGGRRP